jgi:hypothetical protein
MQQGDSLPVPMPLCDVLGDLGRRIVRKSYPVQENRETEGVS